MRKISKILSIAVAGALCIAVLSACGSNAEPTPSATANFVETPTPIATPTPVPTPTPTPTPVATVSPAPSPSALADDTAADQGGNPSAKPSATDTNPDILEEKDEGEAVTEAQERLEALGYLDKVTGYFGTETKAAVEAFQKNNDLDVDGRIGPATLKALMSDDAVKAD